MCVSLCACVCNDGSVQIELMTVLKMCLIPLQFLSGSPRLDTKSTSLLSSSTGPPALEDLKAFTFSEVRSEFWRGRISVVSLSQNAIPGKQRKPHRAQITREAIEILLWSFILDTWMNPHEYRHWRGYRAVTTWKESKIIVYHQTINSIESPPTLVCVCLELSES